MLQEVKGALQMSIGQSRKTDGRGGSLCCGGEEGKTERDLEREQDKNITAETARLERG